MRNPNLFMGDRNNFINFFNLLKKLTSQSYMVRQEQGWLALRLRQPHIWCSGEYFNIFFSLISTILKMKPYLDINSMKSLNFNIMEKLSIKFVWKIEKCYYYLTIAMTLSTDSQFSFTKKFKHCCVKYLEVKSS